MTEPSEQRPADISDAAWLNAPATQHVLACLNEGGYIARVVGGCVRNSLLAKLTTAPAATQPTVTDIDIATTATPPQATALAERAGLKTAPTGLKHGTITVIADGQAFEVTTLRRDVVTDGRHAEVAFTDDWSLDAARRDLTINALYADADGTVFDPLGGYHDLEQRRLRFVGDPVKRIREDYLRILRFFRFYAQYGCGEPDAEGVHACLSERHGLRTLSSERIHQELMKLVVAPGAAVTIRLLAGTGLLTEFLPVAPMPARFERLAALDTPNSDNPGEPSDAPLRLAALSIHVEEDVLRLTGRLRLSRRETSILELVARTLSSHVAEIPTDPIGRRLLYRHGRENYIRAIKFLNALSNDPGSKQWAQLRQLPSIWQPPAFPVAGHDLIALGIERGKPIGNLLKFIESSWLQSDFSKTKTELLTEAKHYADLRQ